MKRLFFIYVLVLALILPACGDSMSQTNPKSLHECGAVPGRTSIWSLEEYETFIAKSDLPSDFIYYSQISSLGTFYGLVYDAGNPNGLSYTYNIVDSNGYKLAFHVLYNPDETLSEKLLETLRPSSYLYSLPADMTNMIKYTGTKLDTSHVYSRHGLDYRYSTLGTLYDISWAEKNKLYIIDGGGSIGNYPMDGQKTIIHCLLSLDEPSSATAFTELKDAINKKS